VLRRVAEALQAAHAVGLVHRDVKPANVLVTPSGQIKITDFGIARAIDSASITEAGQVTGTARYMSPEQALGSEATPASDVYSLAVVGYELLAGHPPFAGEPAAIALAHVQTPPPPLPSWVPAELGALLFRALSKDPSRRPVDAGAFAAELGELEPRLASTAGAHRPAPEPATQVMPRPAALPLDSAPALPMTAIQDTRVADATSIANDASGAAGPHVVAGELVSAGTLSTARSHRRLLFGAVVIVVAVMVAALAAREMTAASPGGSIRTGVPAGATTASDATSTTAAPITIDAASLIGQPAAKVQNDLQGAGLVVVTNDAASAADRVGLVVAVEPTGPVAPGTQVTLTVGRGGTTVAPAAPPTTKAGKGKDKGKERG
jgi:hypothetical protein